MFAGRATGSLRDWPTTGPHRYWQSGPKRTDHRSRLLLRSHGDEEQLGQLLDQILTITRPLPGAPKMLVGNDTYGITGIPTTVAGRGDPEKSGTSRQHKGDLPRFGPQRYVKSYDPTFVDVFSVLELLN